MKAATLFLSVYLAATASVAHAQRPALTATGQVVDRNGQPQSGLPLRVEGPNGMITVVTDQNGHWYLYNLQSGAYRIQALRNSQVESFTVQPGQQPVTVPNIEIQR
jgi:hypothetical protein